MKRIVTSLPFILLVSVVLGILVGLVANEAFMNVVVTVKYVLGQLINFCVPLLFFAIDSSRRARVFRRKPSRLPWSLRCA